MSGLDDLFEAAKAARENAYAPYSDFKVGAAIRTDTGQVFSGCNVENAAYPEGTCAEAGAIAPLVALAKSGTAEQKKRQDFADAQLAKSKVPLAPGYACLRGRTGRRHGGMSSLCRRVYLRVL